MKSRSEGRNCNAVTMAQNTRALQLLAMPVQSSAQQQRDGLRQVWKKETREFEGEEMKCKRQAVFRRFWPGTEPDLVCEVHARDSAKVMEALGFPLKLIRLVPEVEETCCCEEKTSQEIIIDW